MKKIKALIFIILYFIFSFQIAIFAQTKDLNKITSVRLLQDKNNSRIIIGLKYPLENLPTHMATLETVFFDIDAVYVETRKQEVRKRRHGKREEKNQNIQVNHSEIASDEFINNVKWSSDSDKTKFEVKRQYYSPVNFVNQEQPPALLVELPKYYFNKESYKLKPGITRHLVRTVNDRGPVAANVLEVDLSNENISIKVGLLDKKKIKSKSKLTDIVKSEMAFAGINANYFDVKVGNPLGTLITDGAWLTGPVYDRVAIGFSQDKKVLIDQVMLTGNAMVYRGFRRKKVANFEIDGLNTPPHLYKKIGLFTSNWDEEFDLTEGKIAVIVRDGSIKKITKDSAEIPPDGFVLISNDEDIATSIRKRDRIKVDWSSTPDWSGVAEAVSGGPYLIMDGQVYLDLSNQKFKFAKKDTYAPRSAIGIGKNGNLFLIALDGRNNGYSVGLSLNDLAEFLIKLDLKEAINLDGGGSTTLVANGEIINKLSEHHERKISNGLLIFYKE
ncbi:MAG: phosphodiester glycosidase family protein [Candidatus Melainabacteria bacterium]|nr:phosphodiester glycosidase family protein [Candidatus Melainabacteria bacterium]